MARVEPKVAQKYVLVRVDGGEVACVRYERFADGSALAVGDVGYVRLKRLDAERYAAGTIINAEESDIAWRRLWGELEGDGFVEVGEARAAARLPAGWTPPE